MILLLALFACTPPPAEPCMNRADVKRLAQLDLPATTDDLRCYTESGIDTAVLLRFDLPVADVAPFVDSLHLGAPLQEGKNPLRPEKQWPPSWWRAAAGGPHAGVEGATAHRAVKLRVEWPSAERAQIFLLTFTL